MRKRAAVAGTIGVTPEEAKPLYTNWKVFFGRRSYKLSVKTIEDMKGKNKVFSWLAPYMKNKTGQLISRKNGGNRNDFD